MNNLKPFDLQAALAGKAVMLRDGWKAYVRHHETELNAPENYRLIGYAADGDQFSWCESGCYISATETSGGDIIGMYPETRIINGFEVSAPETQAPELGTIYYPPDLQHHTLCNTLRWADDGHDFRVLKRGLVFLNKEDAIANAKAMLGIDPNSDTES